MGGRLSVVATPIGNLEDITLRALRVLREATLIAAEDTRRTARLLQHYSISTPTTSLHAHNEQAKSSALLERLDAGAHIALVSDAGTPGLSDPGARLVAAALERGVRVEPIPGPSAVTAALAASGFAADRFVFAGFPPARGSAREDWFRNLAAEPNIVVLFEAPHRVASAFGLLTKYCPDRAVFVGRELTKVHEQLVRCLISELPERLSSAVGEYTLVLGPLQVEGRTQVSVLSPAEAREEFVRLTEKVGFSRRQAIAEIARTHGLRSRQVFALLEHAKMIFG